MAYAEGLAVRVKNHRRMTVSYEKPAERPSTELRVSGKAKTAHPERSEAESKDSFDTDC
jgi:hypothetical protein